jgi:hypothetical protein
MLLVWAYCRTQHDTWRECGNLHGRDSQPDRLGKCARPHIARTHLDPKVPKHLSQNHSKCNISCTGQQAVRAATGHYYYIKMDFRCNFGPDSLNEISWFVSQLFYILNLILTVRLPNYPCTAPGSKESAHGSSPHPNTLHRLAADDWLLTTYHCTCTHTTPTRSRSTRTASCQSADFTREL